jgi:hypothetical protein
VSTARGGCIAQAPWAWRPAPRRSLLALRKASPRASGGCRPRWSWAPLAATLQPEGGIPVSAETVRRWVHAGGGVWKRAKLVAQDTAPQRVDRLARLRFAYAQLRLGAALGVADAPASHL